MSWAGLHADTYRRQRGVSTNQGSDHDGGGNAKPLGGEVKRLNWISTLKLLDRESKPIYIYLRTREFWRSVQERALPWAGVQHTSVSEALAASAGARALAPSGPNLLPHNL